MRKLTLPLLIAISILLLTGCNPMSMANLKLDPKLPKLQNIKAIADTTFIGFEWQPLAKKGLDGINIYRTGANAYANSSTKQLTKVGTVMSPFASHFVDTGLKQNSKYTYTFTTIKGEYESPHGEVINIQTLPLLPAVSFFQGAQKAKNVIKLIWRPHPDKRVKLYKIYRSVNGEKWILIKNVYNRIMVEHTDTYIKPGNRYQYKISAVGFDKSLSKPSSIVIIDAR